MKRTLTAVLVMVLAPLAVSAQNILTGDVVIRSTPEGALVTISGDVVVSGVTPARFSHLLVGDYRLVLQKPGFERYSSRVVLDPTRPSEIDVRLSRKTSLKAAARSLLIPGWGQLYSEKKTKGYLLGTMAAVSVLAYLAADDEFDYRYDLYTSKQDRYDEWLTTGSQADLRRLKPELDEARRDAYDAENVRRVTIGAIVAVWSVSLLDALFFPPKQGAAISIKGLTVHPAANSDGVELTLSKRF